MKLIDEAFDLALNDVKLNDALHDWYQHQGELPTADRGKPFEVWLNDMLCYCSTLIDETYQGRQTAQQIVYALRINAMGDPFALCLAKDVQDDQFNTGTNCYVEDGEVYAGIWISGRTAEASLAKAHEIEKKFKENGYSTDIWVDEEEACDVTVNATMPFVSHIAHDWKSVQ